MEPGNLKKKFPFESRFSERCYKNDHTTYQEIGKPFNYTRCPKKVSAFEQLLQKSLGIKGFNS